MENQWGSRSALTELPPGIFTTRDGAVAIDLINLTQNKNRTTDEHRSLYKPRPEIMEANHDPRANTTHGPPRGRADREETGRHPAVHGQPGTICNFVIYCLGVLAHVRIKRVTRVHCYHAWIEREAADALAALRAIASGPGISRELWVFLPRGAFRSSGLRIPGLIESDRTGAVMPEKPKQAIRTPLVTPAHPPDRGGSRTPGPGTPCGILRRRRSIRKRSRGVRIDSS